MFEDLVEATSEELAGVSGGAGTKYYVYTVKKGDNLTKLAKRFGTTVDAIYNLNRDKIKDKNLIKIGWKLIIPIKG
ncbi:MAG: LysM peptidoglycan-binding domain-containing protein [Clostridia bacterium]|nr:LysM peptidoglycan-binding domain-containing protein [Lentisphaeria bacterium]MBR5805084.1 LysM peptidoglycan-binding domain-containing protein [Clostridia bacterium]